MNLRKKNFSSQKQTTLKKLLIGGLLLVAHAALAQKATTVDISLTSPTFTTLWEGEEIFIEWPEKFDAVYLFVVYDSNTMNNINPYLLEKANTYCWKVPNISQGVPMYYGRPLQVKIKIMAYNNASTICYTGTTPWITFYERK